MATKANVRAFNVRYHGMLGSSRHMYIYVCAYMYICTYICIYRNVEHIWDMAKGHRKSGSVRRAQGHGDFSIYLLLPLLFVIIVVVLDRWIEAETRLICTPAPDFHYHFHSQFPSPFFYSLFAAAPPPLPAVGLCKIINLRAVNSYCSASPVFTSTQKATTQQIFRERWRAAVKEREKAFSDRRTAPSTDFLSLI